MGTYTALRMGYYVVCKMRQIVTTEGVAVCSGNEQHGIDASAKFCAKCGSPIVEKQIPATEYRSFSPVQYEEYGAIGEHYYPVEGIMTEEDYDWLRDKFELIHNEWIGIDDDATEILIISEFNDYQECDAGVYDMGSPVTGPSRIQLTEYVDQLKRTMLYESVEVKYGLIVTQS